MDSGRRSGETTMARTSEANFTGASKFACRGGDDR